MPGGNERLTTPSTSRSSPPASPENVCAACAIASAAGTSRAAALVGDSPSRVRSKSFTSSRASSFARRRDAVETSTPRAFAAAVSDFDCSSERNSRTSSQSSSAMGRVLHTCKAPLLPWALPCSDARPILWT